jgi:hypothetical protein
MVLVIVDVAAPITTLLWQMRWDVVRRCQLSVPSSNKSCLRVVEFVCKFAAGTENGTVAANAAAVAVRSPLLLSPLIDLESIDRANDRDAARRTISI